jgi:hypothetical protein
VTPDGVKQYKCLYGSEKPDYVVDYLIKEYTYSDNAIMSLFGAPVNLYYDDGEWKMYLPENTLITRIRELLGIQRFVNDNYLFSIEKTYEIPDYKKQEMTPISQSDESLDELIA